VEALTLVVPAIASIALGGALLVPIRDGRHGRKATLGGRAPMLPDFRGVLERHDGAALPAEDGESRAEPQAATLRVVAALSEPPQMAQDEAHRSNVPMLNEEIAPDGQNANDDEGSNGRPFSSFLHAGVTRVRAFVREAFASAPEPADMHASITERSFADELSRLLPLTETDRDVESPLADDEHVHFAPATSGEPWERSATTAMPGASAEESPQAPECKTPPSLGIAVPSRVDRAVPLTRLPLRFVASEIAWPYSVEPHLVFADDAERYAFLRSCASDAGHEHDALLARAFREETPIGRGLILKALRGAHPSPEAIGTFVEALGTGSDEERDTAVDALGEAGARSEVARALSDRIEAIAAKAALAYVGTTARDDYRIALSAFVDEARIDAILGMLAGIVE
jgi:hypothetical protein